MKNNLNTAFTIALTTSLLFIQSCSDKNTTAHLPLIIIDSHVDIAREYMLQDQFDPGNNTTMKVDFAKMDAGGMDGAFFIVYVEQKQLDDEGYLFAKTAAMKKFNAIHKMTDEVHGDKIALAYNADDVATIVNSGKHVAMIGIENGYVIGKDISLVDEYYQLGARYMGLTHVGHNDICDSSNPKSSLGDTVSKHNGVSKFGKEVVARMNKLGMMVDISHTSVDCMMQVIELSKAPVIASHSGVYHLSANPRNLTDVQMKALSESDGVLQVVAYSGYIKKNPERDDAYKAMKVGVAKTLGAKEFSYALHEHTPEFASGYEIINRNHPLASVAEYVDQIEHAIKIMGIDHVGISSDFDGGGELADWQDASQTMNVTKELKKRGHSDQDISKIWGGNLIRVWRAVEDVAKHN